MVNALGALDLLVGRSHECDYPASVRSLPACTKPLIDVDADSRTIDAQVKNSARNALSIYEVFDDVLERLQPTHILTQVQCDVCAVSTSHLAKALHAVSPQPEFLSLTPHTLPDVFRDIEAVGAATGKQDRAAELVASLKQRIARLQAKPKLKSKVACLEWLNPLFNAGHWVPEMVELAGGIDRLGIRGEYSVRIEWQQIFDLDPNVIVIMPCGYDVEKAVQEYRQTKFPPEWRDIQAVQNGRVYAVDASAYFSRPGPRLVDGVEILYSLLHQDFSSSLPAGSWAQI